MTKKAYELVKQKLQSDLKAIHWVDAVVWPSEEARPCLQMSTLVSGQNRISQNLMEFTTTIQMVYYGANPTASNDELVDVADQILSFFQNAFEAATDETKFEVSSVQCEIKDGLLYFKITLYSQGTKESEIYPIMENLKFREV
ncbi:DUF6838 family protein [Fusibacter sp. 3D3]|uniref:phage tail terminator family protein n=1 Tax=Fusibacter sp. 3D3 TaxID=1048380 RepID=UPI000852EEF6|nr:hypothetical protein [Fusibacter sp. 3D3]GAU79512.1 hypothetical protein F3D3_4176 [Fusibacter sp. 3D3]